MNLKSAQSKKSYRKQATDAIIENLKCTDDAELNGNFINTKDCAGFESINTPVNGIEVDVDEL